MDANTELKPQDLLKEILKKKKKTEHNIKQEKLKKKTLWHLFMDGVQLPQG